MKKLFAVSVFVAMVVLSTVSFGTGVVAQQAGNAQADLFHKPFGAGVDCQGNGANTGVPDGGFVNAHINRQRGVLTLNVHVENGLPDTTYDVFVRCIRVLGTLTTNSQGVGNATFKTPAAGIPPTFAIDMHAQPFQFPTLDTLVSEPITLP